MVLSKNALAFLLGFFALALVSCAKNDSAPVDSDLASRTSYPVCQNVGTLERKYPRESLPANMTLVTSTLGQPVFRVGSVTYKANYRGWSSWWLPFSDDSIFNTSKSPLQIYDRWAGRNKSVTQAADWHRKNVFNPKAAPWEGLCAARAFAAAIEVVPTRPVEVDGECVTPADIKALLTLTYENVSSRALEKTVNRPLVFGQQFSGQPDDYLNDIYPDQFLRFAQASLEGQGRPFLMDHSKDVEMWMNVVHEMHVSAVRVADRADAVDVTVVVKMAHFDLDSNEKEKDRRGQLNFDQTNRQYTARLYGCWHGDDFVASSGEWTGRSEFDHPDYVVDIATDAISKISSLRGSQNPMINVAWIDELRDKAMAAQTAGRFCN